MPERRRWPIPQPVLNPVSSGRTFVLGRAGALIPLSNSPRSAGREPLAPGVPMNRDSVAGSAYHLPLPPSIKEGESLSPLDKESAAGPSS